MAYFQRADEAKVQIICILCNVSVNERSITYHRGKCRDANKSKIGSILEECPHDTGHIVPAGKMGLHLEFCKKYQSIILGEYQEILKAQSNESFDDLHDNMARLKLGG